MNYIANNKATLGKLLAGENITVHHKKVQTASFDVKNRVLTLPIYKENILPEVYDTFVAHEVGHALWTPAEGIDEVYSDRKYFQYVNLVEDARIERMIKNKFGGLVRSFNVGYNTLWNDGFFGVGESEIKDLGFADRLNLKAKIGLPIEFSDEEQKLVDRVTKVSSFSEVLEIAREIMEFVKDNNKESEVGENSNGSDDNQDENSNGSADNQNENNSGGSSTELDEQNGDGVDEDNQNENNSGGSSTELDEQNGDGVDEDNQNENNSGGSSTELDEQNGDGVSGEIDDIKTQESFNSGIEEFIDSSNKNINYFTVPKFNLSNFIVPLEEWVKDSSAESVNQYAPDTVEKCTKEFIKFRNENVSVVNHMVKQFEMKKAAEISKRAVVGKTGVIDPTKLSAYRYSDDIFLRKTSVPEGKNHGLVMFIDWSGSMGGNPLRDTIKQLITLVLFCQKTGIQFDVYAFTTGDIKYHSLPIPSNNNLFPSLDFVLYHVLSSSQKKNSIVSSLIGLMIHSTLYCLNSTKTGKPSYHMVDTPLNSTVLVAPQIINEFREKTKVQVTHMVILTDGSPTDSLNFSDNGCLTNNFRSTESYITKNNKNYPLCDPKYYIHYSYSGVQVCKSLIDYVKATTNVSVTGFYLGGGTHNFNRNYSNRYNKFIYRKKSDEGNVLTNCGYDELYYVSLDKNFSSENEDYFAGEAKEDIKEASKDVKKAFKKIGKDKKKKRIILNRFVDLISKPKNIVS